MSSSYGSSRPIHGALLLGIALVAFLTLLALDRGRTLNYAGEPTFWDAHVYASAVHTFERGGDPYHLGTELTFVYPPVFLYVAGALSHVISGDFAWKLYLLLNLLAIVAVPVILAVGYLQSRWFNAGCALLVAAFHPYFTAAFSFFAGNLSNMLYAVVLLTGLPGMRRNRWLWFYVAVAFAAMIKIPMLGFLVLPLLLGEGTGLASMTTAALVIIGSALQWVAAPADYHAYVVAASYQVFGRGDVGFGILSVLFRITRHLGRAPGSLPFAGHALVFGCLSIAMLWIHRRGIPKDLRRWWSSLALLLAVMWNPRMLAYDIDLIVVLTAFLITEMIGVCLARRVSPGLLAGCVLAGLIAIHRSPLNAYYLFAFLCFPIAGYLGLARIAPASDGPRPAP